MEDRPAYYGILPAAVRYDKELAPMARIMYAEITALSNKYGYCTAGNNYFADLYEVSTVTVSRWINSLKKQGHANIEADAGTGQNRKIYPLNKNVTPLNKNVKRPLTKMLPPLNKNVKHNNTSIILQDNNKAELEIQPQNDKDLFAKVVIEGKRLKAIIGSKHYDILNQVCKNEDTYHLLKGQWHDGRFKSLVSWLEYKKESSKGYKAKSAIKKLIVDFSEYTPHEVSTAVGISISSGYAGIFLKVMSDKKVSANKPTANGKGVQVMFNAARKKTSVI